MSVSLLNPTLSNLSLLSACCQVEFILVLTLNAWKMQIAEQRLNIDHREPMYFQDMHPEFLCSIPDFLGN